MPRSKLPRVSRAIRIPKMPEDNKTPIDPNAPNPAVDVAQVMDKNETPYLLWGWVAIALMAHKHDVIPPPGHAKIRGLQCDWKLDKVDIVINEHQLKEVISHLASINLVQCTVPGCDAVKKEEKLCGDPWNLSDLNSLPASRAHFHLDKKMYPGYSLLRLYTQKRLLWWMKTIPKEHDDFITSDDARLRDENINSYAENWKKRYPIKALCPEAFCKALLMLWCRDFDHLENVDYLWIDMVRGFGEYDNHLRACLEKDFRLTWESLKTGRPFQYHKTLRAKLLRAGKLPEDLPPIKGEQL